MARITYREAAYEAIRACLEAGVADVAVERNRRTLIREGENRVLVLRDGDQSSAPDAVGEDRFTVQGTLEGFVEGEDAEVGDLVSALYGEAAEALLRGPIPLGDGLTEIYPVEGNMDLDLASVTESQTPVGAFYLEFTFDLRVPFGRRFLDTPEA
ncbi:hypothetical protein [Roseomonas populi]|uniref:Uncharacterized protein n=1 Tax=Roseomonas populi TaxID=3121582 RepID=A0ABT1X122_9PROT|nr:hypothetical protein [Roseomonas pecuniae]MCR0981793.1 hypothetical protein [Roseomonas pecuniae]